MKKINLNDLIKVQLKEEGKHIYIHQYDHLPGMENYYLTMKNNLDENGFVEMQLWHFIQVFGPYMRMGFELPFSTNIYLRDEDILNGDED